MGGAVFCKEIRLLRKKQQSILCRIVYYSIWPCAGFPCVWAAVLNLWMMVWLLVHFASNSSWFDTLRKCISFISIYSLLRWKISSSCFVYNQFSHKDVSSLEGIPAPHNWDICWHLFPAFDWIIIVGVSIHNYKVSQDSIFGWSEDQVCIVLRNISKGMLNTHKTSSTCSGFGILCPCWSKFAIFLPLIRGYGEPPSKMKKGG